jgi:hypothetical protein
LPHYLCFSYARENVMRAFRKVLTPVTAVAAVAAITAVAPAQALAAAPAQWRTVYTPAGNTVLQGITAASSTDAWAFGQTYYGPHYREVREVYFHWNGKRWRPATVDEPGFVPYAMRDLAVGDVWILGTVTGAGGISPVALHLADGTWHVLAIPAQTNGEYAIVGDQDIWATAGGGCTGTPEVCSTGLVHWNGSAWSTYTVSGEIETLAGWNGSIWAAGINDIRTKVIKKTEHGSVDQVTGTLVLSQFSDGTWQPVTSASPTIADSGPIAFAAAGPDGRLWAVTFPPSGRGTLRYRADGRWSYYRVPAEGGQPGTWAQPVTYDFSHGIWAGAYLRWTGRRWLSVPVDTPSDPLVDQVAAIPGSAKVWGLGSNGKHEVIASYTAAG